MIYHTKGGITFDEAYGMPAYLRAFYQKTLSEQLDRERNVAMTAVEQAQSTKKPPWRPAVERSHVKKPTK